MQDVQYEPGMDHTILHVTDFSSNELFATNDLNDYPIGERIKFSLTAFSEERQRQIRHLKHGQRIFLRNVRAKYGFSLLEGDIGAKGNFAVFVLPASNPAHSELGRAYVAPPACPPADV